MVLVYILGAIDILAGLSLLLLKFGLFEPFAWVMLILLTIKSLPFITSFASIVDLLAAAFILLAIFGTFNAISVLAILWLLQKGLFSFFA
ncbi:MAG: hypothetical protein ABIF40_02920 [archaeon]